MTCDSIVERVKDDLKLLGGSVTPFGKPCKKGHYKIALILAPGVDYHFLVYHKDVVFQVTQKNQTRASIAKKFGVPVGYVQKKASYGLGQSVFIKNAKCWSHKRGTAFPVTLLDSKGKIIKDPRTATFDYGWLNYTVFCTSFCVKKRADMDATIVETKDGDVNVIQYDAVTPRGIGKIIRLLKQKMGLGRRRQRT